MRSPTPAKTEAPLCKEATACINSIINTVLPTPAPPNKPVLPPLTNGHNKSMTLIPVVIISPPLVLSERAAGGACILRKVLVFKGVLSSSGSPKIFNTRPRQSGLTGICKGAPVSNTDIPRYRPLARCSVTARTCCSSRCWCTSNKQVSSLRLADKACRIGGNFLQLITTTGPCTSLITPIACWFELSIN